MSMPGLITFAVCWNLVIAPWFMRCMTELAFCPLVIALRFKELDANDLHTHHRRG